MRVCDYQDKTYNIKASQFINKQVLGANNLPVYGSKDNNFKAVISSSHSKA